VSKRYAESNAFRCVWTVSPASSTNTAAFASAFASNGAVEVAVSWIVTQRVVKTFP